MMNATRPEAAPALARASHWMFEWPDVPALPPLGRPVAIRVKTSATREHARPKLRSALRQVLAAWTGEPPDTTSLRETPRGPEWRAPVGGATLGISLTYVDAEGWIGLVRGSSIGLDAMRMTTFDDMPIVARSYLGPVAWEEIRRAPDRARAFAIRWTALEARLKCFGRPLSEWPTNRPELEAAGLDARHHVEGHTVLTMVVCGRREW